MEVRDDDDDSDSDQGEYSSEALRTEVSQTLVVVKSHKTADSNVVRRAVENGLLLLYNTMTKPQDEERLTSEFCAQGGTQEVVECICAAREHLDAKTEKEDDQGAQAANDDETSMWWECYKILLDMIINFSYTSAQVCSELLRLKLPDVLVSDLLNLKDTFTHSKVQAHIVVSALGILFNCYRKLPEHECVKPLQYDVILSYANTADHTSGIAFLAMLLVSRIMSQDQFNQLEVAHMDKIYSKLRSCFEQAVLSDETKCHSCCVEFDWPASRPEFDLKEVLLLVLKLARGPFHQQLLDLTGVVCRLGCVVKDGKDIMEQKLALIVLDALAKPGTACHILKEPCVLNAMWLATKTGNEGLTCLVKSFFKRLKDDFLTEYEKSRELFEVKAVKESFYDVLSTWARNPSSSAAQMLLDDLTTEVCHFIATPSPEDQSLLFLAAGAGSADMCDYLIKHCQVALNEQGIYQDPDSGSQHQVPPLWVAAVENHLDVVKLLVESGATVNATSDTHSTPVRSACYDNNLAVVKYLVAHGGDINEPNVHGGTCLMNGVRSADLTKYLLEAGAEVNHQDKNGFTALTGAIAENEEESVKLLLDNNADVFTTNIHGDNAIRISALKGKKNMLDLLVERDLVSTEEHIEALEILGTVAVDDENDTEKAQEYWSTAITIRQEHHIPVRNPSPPKLVYHQAGEVHSLGALASVIADTDSLWNHTLYLRERVLGELHQDTSYYLMYRGAVHADNSEYDRALELWQHSVSLRHAKHIKEGKSPLFEDCLFSLLSVSKLLCEIVAGGHTLSMPTKWRVLKVFEVSCLEIEEVSQVAHVKPVYKKVAEHLDWAIKLPLNFISSILALNLDEPQIARFQNIVQQLVKLHPRDCEQRTLLHRAVMATTGTMDDETHAEFPSHVVAKILLNATAPVNVLDQDRNTPLHLLMSELQSRPIVSRLTGTPTAAIARDMLSHGAHIDLANLKGVPAFSGVVTIVPEFNKASHLSLKCLAAHAVNVHQLPYKEIIPKCLFSFVELHNWT